MMDNSYNYSNKELATNYLLQEKTIMEMKRNYNTQVTELWTIFT